MTRSQKFIFTTTILLVVLLAMLFVVPAEKINFVAGVAILSGFSLIFQIWNIRRKDN